MPQQVRDSLDVNTGIQPCRRGAVPQSVDTHAFDARLGRRDLHRAQNVARLDGCAQFGSEHQPRFAPLLSGTQPLSALRCPLRLSKDTMAGDSGTVRRDRFVLASLITSWPPIRLSVPAHDTGIEVEQPAWVLAGEQDREERD